jgi:hypothetical protein
MASPVFYKGRKAEIYQSGNQEIRKTPQNLLVGLAKKLLGGLE